MATQKPALVWILSWTGNGSVYCVTPVFSKFLALFLMHKTHFHRGRQLELGDTSRSPPRTGSVAINFCIISSIAALVCVITRTCLVDGGRTVRSLLPSRSDAPRTSTTTNQEIRDYFAVPGRLRMRKSIQPQNAISSTPVPYSWIRLNPPVLRTVSPSIFFISE